MYGCIQNKVKASKERIVFEEDSNLKGKNAGACCADLLPSSLFFAVIGVSNKERLHVSMHRCICFTWKRSY